MPNQANGGLIDNCERVALEWNKSIWTVQNVAGAGCVKLTSNRGLSVDASPSFTPFRGGGVFTAGSGSRF